MGGEMEALTDRSRRTSRSHISTQAPQGGRVERCSRPKLRTAESATARGSRTTTTARAPGNRRGSTSRSEEHTSELQSLMRISYAVFCLQQNKQTTRSTGQDM